MNTTTTIPFPDAGRVFIDQISHLSSNQTQNAKGLMMGYATVARDLRFGELSNKAAITFNDAVLALRLTHEGWAQKTVDILKERTCLPRHKDMAQSFWIHTIATEQAGRLRKEDQYAQARFEALLKLTAFSKISSRSVEKLLMTNVETASILGVDDTLWYQEYMGVLNWRWGNRMPKKLLQQLPPPVPLPSHTNPVRIEGWEGSMA